MLMVVLVPVLLSEPTPSLLALQPAGFSVPDLNLQSSSHQRVAAMEIDQL